jgi:hypothetical protein
VQTRSAGDAARGTPGFRKGLEADIQVALAGGIAQQLHSPQSYHESQVEDDGQSAAEAAIRYCLEPGNGELGSTFRFEGKAPAEAAELVHRLHEPTVTGPGYPLKRDGPPRCAAMRGAAPGVSCKKRQKNQ